MEPWHEKREVVCCVWEMGQEEVDGGFSSLCGCDVSQLRPCCRSVWEFALCVCICVCKRVNLCVDSA